MWPHISFGVIKNSLLAPESRVDADVVGLWKHRCAPPVAQGRRREVLLILRLHLQGLPVHFRGRRLLLLLLFFFLALIIICNNHLF